MKASALIYLSLSGGIFFTGVIHFATAGYPGVAVLLTMSAFMGFGAAKCLEAGKRHPSPKGSRKGRSYG